MTIKYNRLFDLRYVVLIFIILSALGTYLNTVSNDFVYDDEYEILRNPWIKSTKFIPEIFLSYSWGFQNTESTSYYHPLKFIVHTVQYRIFGTKPWGYHLTNVIVHAIVTVLVFFIGISLFNQVFHEKTIVFPAIASILFAVHPIHTEAVAWIAGSGDLLMSCFFLLSFFVYINSANKQNRRFIISAILFFIATLFKATAMTLPLLLIIYDYSFKKGFFDNTLQGNPFKISLYRRYVPFVIAALAYLSLRTYAVKGFIPEKSYTEDYAYMIFINILTVFAKYLEMLVYPFNLNIMHVFHPVLSIDNKVLLSFCIFALFIALVLVTRKKNRGIFFGLLWITIPLIPVLYIPTFLRENALAERYLYLPSVGFVIALTILLKSIYQRRLFKGMTVLLLFLGLAAVVALFTLQTVKRNSIWKNNYTLWIDTVKKSPDSFSANNNLGEVLLKKGQLDEAISYFRKTIQLNPTLDVAYLNLGVSLYEKGILNEAIVCFQKAIQLNPNYPGAYNNLGNIFCAKEQFEEAIKYYQKAIQLNPYYAYAYNNLGFVYYRMGLLDDAAKEFQIALSLNPDYKEARYNLLMIYNMKNRLNPPDASQQR